MLMSAYLRKLGTHLPGIGLAVMVLAAGILTYLYFQDSRQIAEPSYPIKKHLRYSFNLRNTSDQFIANSTFKAFAPVQQTSSQRVESLAASHPYTLSVDQFGNQVMEFKLEALPPFGTKVISITASMGLSESPNPLNVEAQSYLENSELLDLDHPEIVAAALRLASENAQPFGEAAYKWVSSHVQYSGFNPVDKGALHALQTRSGDCTEYSRLVTALLRQQEIPARAVGGFVTNRSQQVLRATDYHNWSEYLDSKTWILADAQKRVHNEAYEEYIAFRIIEKEEGNPMSNSHRFLAFDPRLAVSMN
jgi:transglutaminase-like putative cysteine protease